DLLDLAQGLSALTARMGPREAATVIAPAASALTRVIKESQGSAAPGQPAAAQAVLAARLDSKAAAPAAITLARVITGNKDPDASDPLGWGLSALLARMGAREAETVAAQVPPPLFLAFKGMKGPSRDLPPLADGVSAVLAAVPAAEIPSYSAR